MLLSSSLLSEGFKVPTYLGRLRRQTVSEWKVCQLAAAAVESSIETMFVIILLKCMRRRTTSAMGFFSSPISDFTNSHHDLQTILKMNDISADVQSHLKLVYTSLALTSLATAMGVFMGITMHLPAVIGLVGTMG